AAPWARCRTAASPTASNGRDRRPPLAAFGWPGGVGAGPVGGISTGGLGGSISGGAGGCSAGGAGTSGWAGVVDLGMRGERIASAAGATSNVGREMLAILEELDFPVDEIHALASRKSIGVEANFAERRLLGQDVETFDFSKVDVVLMSVSGAFSREWAEKIGKAGPLVIDNSSAWRMDPDVPLIVPEVNPEAIKLARRKNIIANPNCSTAQLVVALKPLHDAATIRRAVVSTYQSVSGTGKAAMDELWDQTKAIYSLGPTPPKVYPKQIAFNVIPFAGSFKDDGYTDEEHKMWNETHKMIDPAIKLTVTCVRVPVFVGHSEAVNLEFERPLDED